MPTIRVFDNQTKRLRLLEGNTPTLAVPHDMDEQATRAWVIDDQSLYYLPEGQQFETAEQILVPSDWTMLSDYAAGNVVLARVDQEHQQIIDSTESVRVGVYHLVEVREKA